LIDTYSIFCTFGEIEKGHPILVKFSDQTKLDQEGVTPWTQLEKANAVAEKLRTYACRWRLRYISGRKLNTLRYMNMDLLFKETIGYHILDARHKAR